jgi:hypothetical protein
MNPTGVCESIWSLAYWRHRLRPRGGLIYFLGHRRNLFPIRFPCIKLLSLEGITPGSMTRSMGRRFQTRVGFQAASQSKFGWIVASWSSGMSKKMQQRVSSWLFWSPRHWESTLSGRLRFVFSSYAECEQTGSFGSLLSTIFGSFLPESLECAIPYSSLGGTLLLLGILGLQNYLGPRWESIQSKLRFILKIFEFFDGSPEL